MIVNIRYDRCKLIRHVRELYITHTDKTVRHAQGQLTEELHNMITE